MLQDQLSAQAEAERVARLREQTEIAIWFACRLQVSWRALFLSTTGHGAIVSGLGYYVGYYDSDRQQAETMKHEERMIKAGFGLGIFQAVYDEDGSEVTAPEQIG